MCQHLNVTIDEVYGEHFCEDCGSFFDKEDGDESRASTTGA